MGKILTDDFIEMGSREHSNQRGAVESDSDWRREALANRMVECNVRVHGNTAVVTGVQTEPSTLEGRNGSGTYSYTDVSVERAAHWQVVEGVACQFSSNPAYSDSIQPLTPPIPSHPGKYVVAF